MLTTKRIIGLVLMYCVMFLSITALCLAISINAGRIGQLNLKIAALQELATQTQRGVRDADLARVEQQKADLLNERDSLLGEIASVAI